MFARGLFRLGQLAAFFALLISPAQAQQSSATALSKPQLEQLVAPIALHPDALLSQILMASTYPTEVVQAARWSRENPGMTGQTLQDAMQKQPWDPSVKALTAVPQMLQMLSDKLDWTQQLGDAFLSQQEDLLAAVQDLRQRADAAGTLKSSENLKVGRKQAEPATGKAPVITIESATPDYMYVPVYDPRVAFGDWLYPEYEPFYWYPAGFTGTGVVSFVAGIAIGAAIWGDVDWWRGRVDIDVDRYNRFNRTDITNKAWTHNPRHRGNVPYRDAHVAQRFGDANRAAGREAFRGKAEAGRRDLANTKAGADAKGKAAAKGKSSDRGAKHAGKGGSAAKSKSAAHANRGSSAKRANAAQSKQASRQKVAARKPQQRARGPGRQAQNYGFRPKMSANRASFRGGGFRGGRGGFGGGRRGRR